MQLKEQAQEIQNFLDENNVHNLNLCMINGNLQLRLPVSYMFRKSKTNVLYLDRYSLEKAKEDILKNYGHVVRNTYELAMSEEDAYHWINHYYEVHLDTNCSVAAYPFTFGLLYALEKYRGNFLNKLQICLGYGIRSKLQKLHNYMTDYENFIQLEFT